MHELSQLGESLASYAPVLTAFGPISAGGCDWLMEPDNQRHEREYEQSPRQPRLNVSRKDEGNDRESRQEKFCGVVERSKFGLLLASAFVCKNFKLEGDHYGFLLFTGQNVRILAPSSPIPVYTVILSRFGFKDMASAGD